MRHHKHIQKIRVYDYINYNRSARCVVHATVPLTNSWSRSQFRAISAKSTNAVCADRDCCASKTNGGLIFQLVPVKIAILGGGEIAEHLTKNREAFCLWHSTVNLLRDNGDKRSAFLCEIQPSMLKSK